MTRRSTLLASNYNAWPEPFNGQAYAFLNVIQALENADLLCPGPAAYAAGRGVKPSFPYLIGELRHRTLAQARRKLGKGTLSSMMPQTVARDYDLFMFMCQFPLELGALDSIKGWRERSGQAVCYLLESWPHRFEEQKGDLKLLDKFDCVFVLNADSIPALSKYTSAPLSFLPTGTDTLLATPLPNNPQRCIDVLSIGRKEQVMHDKLVDLASSDNDFYYMHDITRAGSVPNWREHRLQTADTIKRSKYFMAYDLPVDKAGVDKGIKKYALSTRYFEGAAGGAVLLGSAQETPKFKEYFDWDDAVIDLPLDTADLRGFFADLNSQKERIDHIRLTNVVQSLRRHDWAHRWGQILDTLGLERPAGLETRLEALASLADAAEKAGGPTAARDQRIIA
ncbi:glycosyltransferase [soil metagenome]